MAQQSIFEKMQAIDRRWIFLFMGLAVIVPFAFDIAFTEVATPEVQAVYDAIENLPEGSPVLLPFDFDPPSEPELKPMAISFVRHLAMKKHKIYFMALWPMGQSEVRDVVNQVIKTEFPEMVYGEDYVMLGYKPGGQGVIQVLVSDFRALYTTDADNTPIDDIPMMKKLYKLGDAKLILNVSSGTPGLKEWVQFGADKTGVPIAGGMTAVQAPLLYPYYPAQLTGIMGGLKAAAEYESLIMLGYPEKYGDPDQFTGLKRMGPQTFAHLVIILFIIIGNIAFFATRGKTGPRLKSLGS